jgi:hypothetical protein
MFADRRPAGRVWQTVSYTAAHEAEMHKRSYWQCLDGYAFERATAEVLNKHQFNPRVTPGSGDGGIDRSNKKRSQGSRSV